LEREGKKYYPYDYDDEIDLYELWLTLKKRKLTVFLVTFLFLFIAIAYSLFSPDIYRIESIVALPKGYVSEKEKEKILIPFSVTKDILDKLDSEIKNKDFGKVSSELHLPRELLSSISEIDISNYRKVKGYVKISIEGRNKDYLLPVKDAVIGYLNGNDYVREQVKEEKESLKRKLQVLSKKLASLKKTAQRAKELVLDRDVKTIGFNPLDIDKTIIDLKFRINDLTLALKSKIHGYREVDYYLTDKPVKPKRKLIIAVGLISGLFLGIFLAFFKEWLENVRRERES